MKTLRSHIGKLGRAAFSWGKAEATVATPEVQTATKSQGPEYSKLKLPRGRWEQRGGAKPGQQPRFRPQDSGTDGWASFARKGAYGLGGGTMMLLLYANRNNLPGLINGVIDESAASLKEARNMISASTSRPLFPGYPAGANFLADAAAKAVPAVVNLSIKASATSSAQRKVERPCGSGFITDSSGVIMTSAYVLEDAVLKQQELGAPAGSEDLRLRAVLQDGRAFEARVLSMDRVSGLALLKIEADAPLPAVQLGNSGSMRVGEWVLALGSPLTLQNSVTAGIVSCVGRKAKELGLRGSTANYIQTDAAIDNGSAGGPLVNLNGEVVGVSCMKALNSTGVSFAIPINTAKEIMKQMRDGDGRVVRPYIGIKMLQLNAENAAQMHRRDSKFPATSAGVLVPGVSPGSPAAKAGLKAGDIITGFGEAEKVATTSALVEALSQNIGQRMKLHVKRGNQNLLLVITACEAWS